jgi:hypothetical protein
MPTTTTNTSTTNAIIRPVSNKNEEAHRGGSISKFINKHKKDICGSENKSLKILQDLENLIASNEEMHNNQGIGDIVDSFSRHPCFDTVRNRAESLKKKWDLNRPILKSSSRNSSSSSSNSRNSSSTSSSSSSTSTVSLASNTTLSKAFKLDVPREISPLAKPSNNNNLPKELNQSQQLSTGGLIEASGMTTEPVVATMTLNTLSSSRTSTSSSLNCNSVGASEAHLKTTNNINNPRIEPTVKTPINLPTKLINPSINNANGKRVLEVTEPSSSSSTSNKSNKRNKSIANDKGKSSKQAVPATSRKVNNILQFKIYLNKN